MDLAKKGAIVTGGGSGKMNLTANLNEEDLS